MSQELIAIGKIVAPHGVRGDVRIIPLTDFPERFQQLKTAYFDDGSHLAVEAARSHKKFILLKFRGLDNMNAVEHLRNKIIKVPPQDLVKLPDGQYYIFDIIGLKVYSEETDEYYGEVTDVLQTGSNDVYVVEHDGQVPLMVPALKDVVKKIDLNAKKILVKLQEWE